MSSCNCSFSLDVPDLAYSFLPSAKITAVELFWMQSGRSSVYKTNKVGPRTEPCGGLLVTCVHLDESSPTLTLFISSGKETSYLFLQWPAYAIRFYFSEDTSMCHFVKTYIKSMYMTSVVPPSSIISVHMSKTYSSWRVVDLLFIKPYWQGLKCLLLLMCDILSSLTSDSRSLQTLLNEADWSVIHWWSPVTLFNYHRNFSNLIKFGKDLQDLVGGGIGGRLGHAGLSGLRQRHCYGVFWT